MLGGLQPLLTPDLGDLRPSSGFWGTCTHRHVVLYRHKDIYIIKNKYLFKMSLYSCWYQIHARSTQCMVPPPLKFPLSWNRHSGSFLPLSQLSFLLFMVEQTGECLVSVAQIPSLWCLSTLPCLHISVYNICSSYSTRWKSPGQCLSGWRMSRAAHLATRGGAHAWLAHCCCCSDRVMYFSWYTSVLFW